MFRAIMIPKERSYHENMPGTGANDQGASADQRSDVLSTASTVNVHKCKISGSHIAGQR